MEQEREWPFSAISWWLCAIHDSCSHESMPKLLSSCWHGESNEVSLLKDLATFYNETLTLLSQGRLTVVDATRLLFRAKALKKWKYGPPELRLERRDAAISGFIERNDRAANAGPIPYPYSYWMREVLRKALPDPTGSGFEWTGRFGPGQVFESYAHPLRFEKLKEWCEFEGWPEVPLQRDLVGDPIARLSAVPKDALKDRLITVESCYNSFVQQYVREALQTSVHIGCFANTCMDLYATDGQAIQRRLALKASRNNALATLDLSDASDGITWEQVQQVFPAWCCHLFDVSRSSRFTYRGLSKSVASLPLNIFAGMGNGSTFTVETLFFSAFVKAYALAHNLPRFVSVFGDDIICHSTTACALMKENFPFFQINHTKSFAGGSALREACGVFAYKGWDITCPKIDGYRDDNCGVLGLCDLHKRLRGLSPRFPYASPLSLRIAETGLLNNICSAPEGSTSIDDNRCPRVHEPKVRYNPWLQEQEVLSQVARPRECHYATDWRAAKAFNHPSPDTWYLARLCGMLGRTDWSITNPKSVRRMSVSWPCKNQLSFKRNWFVRPIAGLLREPRAGTRPSIG